MGLRVSIHQPYYLPWLRYVHKIASSDLFILLDDVPYVRNCWQNRNRIKSDGGAMYLTVPVSAVEGQPARCVGIVGDEWCGKHLWALQHCYGRCPGFGRHLGNLVGLYAEKWRGLDDLNEALLAYCLSELNIHTPIVRSSETGVPGTGAARLANLCRAVGGTAFYSGEQTAMAHLPPEVFERAGVELQYQEWTCPEYRQQYPRVGFVPDLSIVDLLFNEGEKALEVLKPSDAHAQQPAVSDTRALP